MLVPKEEKEKVSLEHLLRLKKKEMPPELFWNRFDRELERKIVQSVVRRESVVSRYIHRHWKISGVFACAVVAMTIAFQGHYLAHIEAQTPVLSDESSSIDSEELASRWEGGTASSFRDSEQSFVIEILSSGAGVSSGAGRTWIGSSSDQDTGAYYVADQLSSSDLGWSGERLPF
ncbi:MAG: hypothetical protein AAGJ81_07055 [Verrucomicrobiota bacterium]